MSEELEWCDVHMAADEGCFGFGRVGVEIGHFEERFDAIKLRSGVYDD